MTDRAATAGEVQTVLGPVSPASLGLVLPHKHILCNVPPPELKAASLPEFEITLQNARDVRYHWIKTIKIELIWRTTYTSRWQATKAIGEYIEGFYNPRRQHSSLDYKSPAAFETAFHATIRQEQSALH